MDDAVASTGAGRAEVAYETGEPHAYRWTDAAYDALVAGTLHAEATRRGGVGLVRVWGRCPNCHDPLDETVVLEARMVGGPPGADGADERAIPPEAGEYARVDVRCGCARQHPGGPAGERGCGIVFRVEPAWSTR